MALKQQKTSAVRVERMQDDDLEQVLALYRRVFGPAYASSFSRRWEWAHHEGPFKDESHRWLLRADRAVVGFLAALPLPYSIGGQHLVAHTPCDFMVHPDFRFHGIKLMRQFFASCPNCVTCDDIPASIRVTRLLGAQAVGPLITYVKALDGRAFAADRRLSKMPDVSHRMATSLLRGLDSLLFRRADVPGVTVNSVDDFDDRFERFRQRMAAAVPAALDKGVPFLRWRYGPSSPSADREIVTATNHNGELTGYAVLQLISGLRPTGYILDLQVAPDADRRVTKAVLAHAVRSFRRMGALTMKLHALPSPFAPDKRLLTRLGFMARNRGGRLLMAKLADPALAEITGQASNWSYGFGDAEASHSLA